MVLSVANINMILKQIEEDEEEKFRRKVETEAELKKRRRKLDKTISSLSLLL